MEHATQIREVLRSGAGLDDQTFDHLYATGVRARSEVFWTPVAVALRAAALLAPASHLRILDVGAGPGKLCCVGALATDAWWHGIERDPSLVAVARSTARTLEVASRASFICGDMSDVDWAAFDGLYLYNPFEAALYVDDLTERSDRWIAFDEQVERAEQRLAEMPAGTRVVTYHGFGGEMPDGYTLASREPMGTDYLALWIKGSTHRAVQSQRASA